MIKTGLSSFDTAVHNSVRTFIHSWQNSYSGLTEYIGALIYCLLIVSQVLFLFIVRVCCYGPSCLI